MVSQRICTTDKYILTTKKVRVLEHKLLRSGGVAGGDCGWERMGEFYKGP